MIEYLSIDFYVYRVIFYSESFKYIILSYYNKGDLGLVKYITLKKIIC